MLNLETAQSPHKLRRVAIEPVTRVEGHGKVTILLDDENRDPSGPAPHRRVSRLRGLHPGPAVLGGSGRRAASLRHLPGQPSARRDQGDGPHRRLRAADADGREAAPPAALWADRAVARAAFLPPLLARSPARLRERGRQAQHHRRRRGVSRSRQAGRHDPQIRAGSHPRTSPASASTAPASFPAA